MIAPTRINKYIPSFLHTTLVKKSSISKGMKEIIVEILIKISLKNDIILKSIAPTFRHFCSLFLHGKRERRKISWNIVSLDVAANRYSESRNIITAFTRTKVMIRSFVLNLTAKSSKRDLVRSTEKISSFFICTSNKL